LEKVREFLPLHVSDDECVHDALVLEMVEIFWARNPHHALSVPVLAG
jgi:hypothetical protein